MRGPIAIDDLTGFKVDYSALKKQWDGAWTVDPDKRNPQDLIRARSEVGKLDHPRPESADVFTATNITLEDGLTPIMCENGAPLLTEGPLNGAGL
jgi:hypothetical protein